MALKKGETRDTNLIGGYVKLDRLNQAFMKTLKIAVRFLLIFLMIPIVIQVFIGVIRFGIFVAANTPPNTYPKSLNSGSVGYMLGSWVIPLLLFLLFIKIFRTLGAKKSDGNLTTMPTVGQQLVDLQKAKDSGAISDTEYQAQKAKLIDSK
jgi:uncharacterized membrane protein